ncbi:MAG: hypothetical protein QNJ75_00170 [Acidimicrobiia bacterium]|nr:hypothetical protein [Acidimicrobiia bacterium]
MKLSDAGPARLFAITAGPLFALYLATASWTLPYHIDTATNVFTAWELATNGDVYLDSHAELATPEYIRTIAWVVPAGDSVASQYPPGAPLLAAPLYAVWPEEARHIVAYNEAAPDVAPVALLMPPLGPAAITSALVAAITVGFLALVFSRLVDTRTALLAAYLAGLGTGVWSVAADMLWQHGPAMLWIVVGMLLSIGHRWWSGFAYGAAVITRPHTALIAAGNGLTQSYRQRSILPAVQVGAGAALGLAGLIAFNAAVFGSPSITGGYASSFAERATDFDLARFGGNLVLALVHPERGLLVYSPFLILLIPGLLAAWRKAPAWVQGSAIGGAAYLLLQLKANRYSGGDSFWGYRYPLEMLAAGAPLLLLSYTEWLRHRSKLYQRVFLYAIVASIVIAALGAVYF